MPERDLALLIEAARAAGQIAMSFWKNTPQVWTKPDASPVTEADLAVNHMLQVRLGSARPHYGWLSEETPDDAARLSSEHIFIIDPIDGTRAFIAGEKHFSHSLAVARNGEITAAVVYVPALNQMYTATIDGPALLNNMPIKASSKALFDQPNILMSKATLGTDHWIGPPPNLRRSFRASVAYRLALVADGSFDAMLSFRKSWEWDIAAGSLIAQRAGAKLCDVRGDVLRFNTASAQSNGIYAGSVALFGELQPLFNA